MKIICSRSLVLFPPDKTDYITKNRSDSYSNLIYCVLYLIYLIHSVLIIFSTENHLKRKRKVCNILYRFQPATDLLPLFRRRLAQEHWNFKYALPQKILCSGSIISNPAEHTRCSFFAKITIFAQKLYRRYSTEF